MADKDRFKRRLISGAGTFPPEDCGGIWGYYHCLDILNGKEKDENNIKEWLGDWLPNEFSPEEHKTDFDLL